MLVLTLHYCLDAFNCVDVQKLQFFFFEKWIFVLYLYLYFSLLNFEGLKIYSGNDQIIKIGRGYYIGIVATAFVVLTVTTFILFKCCGYFFLECCCFVLVLFIVLVHWMLMQGCCIVCVYYGFVLCYEWSFFQCNLLSKKKKTCFILWYHCEASYGELVFEMLYRIRYLSNNWIYFLWCSEFRGRNSFKCGRVVTSQISEYYILITKEIK
jgi:hypothetical protein